MWASVGDSVRASVRASVGASVRDSVWDSVGASVRASVGASVRDSVWDSVRDSVRDSVVASVGDSVRASVVDSVWDSVRDSVRASVVDSVGASARDSVGDACYGQHDASWLAFYQYFSETCGLAKKTAPLVGLTAVAQSAGWFWPHEEMCWLTERPNRLLRDEQGRLVCEEGPSLTYPDCWSLYHWHGLVIPGWIVEKPKDITPEKITAESNAEIRRVMIEKMWEPASTSSRSAPRSSMPTSHMDCRAHSCATSLVINISTDPTTAPAASMRCRSIPRPTAVDRRMKASCGFDETLITHQS